LRVQGALGYVPPDRGDPKSAALDANRKGALFNYLGIGTVDGIFLESVMVGLATRKLAPPLMEIDLNKRGFLSFVFGPPRAEDWRTAPRRDRLWRR
jgi:hypothetical protein